jgi:hypothetical protein
VLASLDLLVPMVLLGLLGLLELASLDLLVPMVLLGLLGLLELMDLLGLLVLLE